MRRTTSQKPKAESNRLNADRWTLKRVTAMALCASMALSSFASLMTPTRAVSGGSGGSGGGLRDLYTREADKNTMDSYVQASLGGLIYLQEGVDGVSTPTVRNNFGSRFAGEIWADKSVFAQYQNVIAEIRPFEAGHVYDTVRTDFKTAYYDRGTTTELQRALDTLAYWGVSHTAGGFNSPAALETALKTGALTAAQASALNDAVNKAIAEKYANGGYKYNGDGDFHFDDTRGVGVLQLGRDTDGVNGTVVLPEGSDFLHVFSVLGSSEVKNDEIPTPLDVVFILDTSASMSSTGEATYNNGNNYYYPDNKRGRYTTDFQQNYVTDETFTDGDSQTYNVGLNRNTRLEYAADALNNAFEALLEGEGNEYNRVALVTFDLEAHEVMPLGRYVPNEVDRTPEQSGGYLDGAVRYFTIAQADNNNRDGIKYDNRFPQRLVTDDTRWKYWPDEISNNDAVAWRRNALIDLWAEWPDWKVIEINATGENGEEINQIKEDWESEPPFPEIKYLYTQGGTAIPQGVFTGMQILATENEPTVKLWRDNNGKLTDVAPAGAGEPDVTLQRKPIVVILADGAPNPTTINSPWWDIDEDTVDVNDIRNHDDMQALAALISAATAAYWKKAINDHYFNHVAGTGEGDEKLETEIYTFGFALADPENTDHAVKKDGRIARATLNPAGLDGYYDDAGIWIYYEDDGTPIHYQDVRNYRTLYINHSDINITRTVDQVDIYKYTMPYPDDGDPYDIDRSSTEAALKDLNYPTAYQQVDDPKNLPNIFGTLIETVTDTPYTPIGGTNSAGVGDAVTYSDPIGDYMNVDGVTDLTLFGHHYRLKPVEVGGKTELTYAQAVALAPALNDTTASVEKQANTTYTVYRIVSEDGVGDITAANSTRWNRSFVPEGAENNVTGDDLRALQERYQFDLLTDIQIWVEDTGEWRDSGVGDYIVEDGYSESLYVNISAKAIPTQIATITKQGDNYASNYETNLDEPEVSTPLRIFYDVSFDTDYLRYYATGVDKEKRNATGVALTSISTEYLEKNTSYYAIIDGGDGFYDEVKTDADGARRMVAFYSNYFTDSRYNEFAVMSDKNKSSRGNAAVSFAPSADNDFYRFQKNRTLYLIPGSFGLEERPAEIDLGDLSGTSGVTYYVNETTKAISTTKDAGFTALDPTNYEHLLALLNYERATANNGAPTPYWYFGDCEFVDEGSIPSSQIHGYFQNTRKPADGSEAAANVERLHAELEKNLEDAGVPGDHDSGFDLPKIASQNWYYIIREYYYPIYGTDGKLDHTEIHYLAIARKGSELGTGVGAGDQEYVCWYKLEDGAVRDTFNLNAADGKFGKPEEDGTWYIAAAKGGLRVGSMANFAGVKNYDIREGVSEGVFSSTDNEINLSNVTNTAKTYFLPTISTYRGGGANALSVVVNAYLGNNGRILVDDSTLVVTKTVNTVDGGTGSGQQLTEEFEMLVRIENFYGVRGAVLITRDEFNRELWRRRFDTIDVLTNNQNLLLGDDSNLAMVDKNGQRVVLDDDGYYYRAKKGSDGEVIKYVEDENGKLIEDAINGSIIADKSEQVTDGVYYVYVGSNLSTALYGDKTLRVFKADIPQDADGYVPANALTAGDIYGNKSLRGGRTYYVSEAQYAALEEEGVTDKGGAFDFRVLTEEDKAKGYQIGDREFWINKVYLIPINAANWEAAFDGNDWQGYPQESTDEDKIGGYTMLPRFKVAHIRAADEEGATTATELASNNGFYIESQFLTTKVEFEDTGNGYGEAVFNLRDGQGLGFNNIDTGAWYTVTEQITEEQVSAGIRFQQVEHVQEDGQRARYVYDESDPLKDSSGVTPRRVNGIGKEEEDGTRTYTLPEGQQPGVKNVGAVWGYRSATNGYNANTGDLEGEGWREGKFYYWWNNGSVSNQIFQTTANFGTPNNYTIAGDTSLEEEAVHYVNYLPDIKKLELTPGKDGDITDDEGDSVYVGSFITYAIRWENYEYNTEDGEPQPATVIISDPLDEGVDFVSASFSPYHGNMADKEGVWHFDEKDYLKEYQIVANTLLEVATGDLKEGVDNAELYNTWIRDQEVLFVAAKMDENKNPKKEPVSDTQTYYPATIPGLSENEPEKRNMKVELKYDAAEHKVSWTIDAAPARTYGYVELTVWVNSGAVRDWDIDENGNITGDDDAIDKQVVDRAVITAGDNPERWTNRVWNPTGDPHKTETNPGEGIQVAEGQALEYSVEWTNTKNEKANVIIEDRLDDGVDFSWAKIEGDDPAGNSAFTKEVRLDQELTKSGKIWLKDGEVEVTITYDPDAHVIRWELNGVPAMYQGEVTFGVIVNDQADYVWDYEYDDNDDWDWKEDANQGPGADNDEEKDNRIRNQARISLDNGGSWQYTNTIENPTKPEKTETKPGDSNGDGIYDDVAVGQEITYRITWMNDAVDDAGQPVGSTVTIIDKLDPGATFVEAGFMTKGSNGQYVKGGVPAGCKAAYDEKNHTVTWTLENQLPRAAGMVYLIVKVNERAFEDWDYRNDESLSQNGVGDEDKGALHGGTGEDNKVVNKARVQVENGSNQFTDVVENPLMPLNNLTVTKTVTGNAGDRTKEFHFSVTLSDEMVDGPYGDMTFVRGVATFTLKHGESKTASGLPAGITYTVTEAEADEDGYKTTATGEAGTIPDGGTAEAVFVNDKNNTPSDPGRDPNPGRDPDSSPNPGRDPDSSPGPGRGGLTVSKTVTGNTGQ